MALYGTLLHLLLQPYSLHFSKLQVNNHPWIFCQLVKANFSSVSLSSSLLLRRISGFATVLGIVLLQDNWSSLAHCKQIKFNTVTFFHVCKGNFYKPLTVSQASPSGWEDSTENWRVAPRPLQAPRPPAQGREALQHFTFSCGTQDRPLLTFWFSFPGIWTSWLMNK